MDLSRFLTKILPVPDFLNDGSLWLHIMRHGIPFTVVKFKVSKARSAERKQQELKKEEEKKIQRTVLNVMIIDVGISKRFTGSRFAANTNRCDWTDGVENFEQHSFVYIESQVTDI